MGSSSTRESLLGSQEFGMVLEAEAEGKQHSLSHKNVLPRLYSICSMAHESPGGIQGHQGATERQDSRSGIQEEDKPPPAQQTAQGGSSSQAGTPHRRSDQGKKED